MSIFENVGQQNMVNARIPKGPMKAQKFRTKSQVHEAIQFTGINGNDVTDFARQYGAVHAHNGGQWVSITSAKRGFTIIRRKDLLVYNGHALRVLSAEDFMDQYSVDKSHVFMKPDYVVLKSQLDS